MNQLHVELLESRLTPASLTFSAGTLTYQGDAVGHRATFIDDGQGDVTALVFGGGNGVIYRQFAGVRDFQSYDGTGPDQIDYVFTGQVTNDGTVTFGYDNPAETVTAVVTAGSSFYLDAELGVAHGALLVDAIGFDGAYRIDLGPVAAGAGVQMNAYNYGGFSVATNVRGALAGFVEYDYAAYGAGGDAITNYDGVLTGTFYTHQYAYTAGHTFDAEFTAEAGSTGGLTASIHSAGDDPTTMNVYDGGGALTLDAYLSVAAGNPNVRHTPNVEVEAY